LDVDLFELGTESDASSLVRFRGSPNWSVASLVWSEYCYILSRCEHGFLNRESGREDSPLSLVNDDKFLRKFDESGDESG
jgi:hypothetical protein